MATDIDISHYNTGTATVAANGTAVTGQGTTWQGAVRPGDMFGTHKGDGIRILSVDSNTSLTLAYPWTGGAQTAAPYEIQRTPYDLGYQKAVEDFLTALQNGNLPAFAALPGAANKLPYFNGANSMALADFPAWARALFAETGQLPNARVRNDLTPDKAFRRGNILGEVSRSGGVPTGAIIEHGSNANGIYARYADGWQVCVSPSLTLAHINASLVGATWTFPVSFVPGGHVGGGIGFPSASANYTDVSSRDLGATIFNPQPSRGSATVGTSRITGAPSDTGASIINCYAYASGPWI